ncbi:RDD family protein [Aquabacterium sp. OR-4]|uniref:RDD family protein n=1 Tax=Aquabacterium sp. OR-4 TaxID=2978127 RepID=UPI0028C78CDE|nr:RDD family protein [Aquabacterium sp. OR-4]MDT7833692.1 RDD family protein [Aquabacterium sp. OR-4]
MSPHPPPADLPARNAADAPAEPPAEPHTEPHTELPAGADGRGRRDGVSPEDLNVDPALLGQPLARPGRRAAAMAIDGLWIAAFNALGNAWVMLALAALLLWQHLRRRSGWRAPDSATATATAANRPWRAVAAAALLLGLGALTHHDDEPRQAAAVPDEAADGVIVVPGVALGDMAALVAEAASAPASAALAATAASAASMGRRGELDALRRRIQAQSDELQRLRAPGLGAWQARAEHWLDQLGEGWLWSLLYFTLLPAGWLGGRPGQTLGKRLLGLRVVELTGKPMTPLRNLKRYGGYAAGMATGGLGLAQLLWDPNRQAIQDKTAHTVVLDGRSMPARNASWATRPLAAEPPDVRPPAGPAGG